MLNRPLQKKIYCNIFVFLFFRLRRDWTEVNELVEGYSKDWFKADVGQTGKWIRPT